NMSVAQINYPARTALPPNTVTPNAGISGLWECYLEVPDNGFYNFYIETDASAEVQLSLERKELDKPNEPNKSEVEITLQNGIWQNQKAIALKAGQLYSLKLIVKKVKDKLILKWESKGLAKESIPTNYLYPSVLVDRFTSSYLRLLKTFAIAEALDLSATEVNYFGTYSDYQLNSEGWLNALPTSLLADNAAILPELLKRFTALLHYGELKESLKVKDDLLIKIFVNPNAITEDKKSLLERVTSWDNISLNAFYNHFGLTSDDLKHLEAFIRINETFNLVKKIGIKASTLVTNTTNEPTADIIRNLQSALRARYDESAWFQVIQPINDKLRNLQRDALVTFILNQFQQTTETKHINTPDKLFEYFLI
ncbi:MAG: neuraminidase-like domain-containing protein, partial [Waterburya sp.]